MPLAIGISGEHIPHNHIDSQLCVACRDDYNPFETFAKLFERQNYADQELLHKLTTDCLMASETTRLCERRFVLHIFDQVRSIFEYITANEYTVWFFVPRLNSYTTLEQVVSWSIVN